MLFFIIGSFFSSKKGKIYIVVMVKTIIMTVYLGKYYNG